MVCKAADHAVQIHGGMGYMRGTTVERIARDRRVMRIYEGTSEVQKLIVGRAVACGIVSANQSAREGLFQIEGGVDGGCQHRFLCWQEVADSLAEGRLRDGDYVVAVDH